MPVLLISKQTLLCEALNATLSEAGFRLIKTEPVHAAAAIRRVQPRVIVADGALAPAALSSLLTAAGGLPCCRVILVNASGSDLTMFDLHCRRTAGAADLVDVVREGLARPATSQLIRSN